jgi:hypothetical protein
MDEEANYGQFGIRTGSPKYVGVHVCQKMQTHTQSGSAWAQTLHIELVMRLDYAILRYVLHYLSHFF